MKNLMYMFMLATSGLVIQGYISNNGARKATDSNYMVTNTVATDNLTVANNDVVFFIRAADECMTEVALGKLATDKSSNQQIREFVQVMITDHNKINKGLLRIAKDENISPLIQLGENQQKRLDDLTKMSRKEFDTTYINELINRHEKMLGLMQNELNYGEDPALKAFAARTISIIQMHLYSVERIHDSMK